MNFSTSDLLKKLFFLFLFFAGLYYAKDFLMPLSIGTVLATLFWPLCKWLELKKTPRLLAAIACLLLLLVVITGITSLVGWQISELANDFALMKEKVAVAVGTLQDYLLKELGISIEKQTQLFTDQQPMITGLIKDTLGSFTTIFTFFMIILIYLILLLYYRSHIKNFILMLSPQSKREEMGVVVNSVARVSQQYLLGLSKMIVCLWVMYGIGFSALGIKNALFFAFLCGLLEIVPFIGNITGTTITLLMAALHGSSPAVLAAIVGVYGTVQFVQGWVLEPLIVGSQVKINPLSTIVALILGELVWGIPGIFLAIPLVAMLKIVCDNIESLKPYGFLIGETEKKKKTKK